jgi:hypothetical protein
MLLVVAAALLVLLELAFVALLAGEMFEVARDC